MVTKFNQKPSIKTRAGKELKLSPVGLGTAPLGNMFAAQSEEEAAEALHVALDRGVDYFDTAPLYGLGLSERRLGMVLSQIGDRALTISTKVGRILEADRSPEYQPFPQWVNVPKRKIIYDYSYDGVMRSFEHSLERLGLSHIDILYCHDLDLFTHKTEDVRQDYVNIFMSDMGGYRAMEDLRAMGAVSAIGLGVNEWEICEYMANQTDMDLFLLAGRFTLLEQHALKSFLPLCLKRKMHVVVGGPFNSGILATGPIEGAHFNYEPAPRQVLEHVRDIKTICDAHGVELKEAAVQFPLLHQAVMSVIPGGALPAHIAQNIDAFEAEIPPSLWEDLQDAGFIDQRLELIG